MSRIGKSVLESIRHKPCHVSVAKWRALDIRGQSESVFFEHVFLRMYFLKIYILGVFLDNVNFDVSVAKWRAPDIRGRFIFISRVQCSLYTLPFTVCSDV